MKRLCCYAVAIVMFLLSCNNTTEKNYNEMIESGLSRENAHPKAQELLKSEIYWSPIEESAPFGNDDGFDTFYLFLEWRQSNPDKSPVDFLYKLFEEWGLPEFDPYTLEPEKIKAFMKANDRVGDMDGMGYTNLLMYDNAIIATGFGQFVGEGTMDDDMKRLTRIALKRQQLPFLLNKWKKEDRNHREAILKEMTETLESIE